MRQFARSFIPLLAVTMIGVAPTLALADESIKAFYTQKCEVCHTLGGKAGKMAQIGGPLDGVGAKRDAEWLKTYLVDPKKVMPDAKMPAIKMTDEQLDAMVAYMLSLK